jgi:hypothetical protein
MYRNWKTQIFYTNPMNVKSYTIVGSVAAMLLFVGCTNTAPSPTSNPITAPSQQKSTDASINQKENFSINGTSEKKTIQTQESMSEPDKAAYIGAMKLGDTSMCDKISNESFKKQCKADVSDTKAEKEAIAKLDPSICVGMSTNDKQEVCKIHVETEKAIKLKSSQELEQVNEYNQLLAKLSSGNDPAACSELKNADTINECQDAIYFREAQIQKDKSVCSKIKNTETKSVCDGLF